MRQIISSGSVKAISLNREEIFETLREISKEASKVFPQIVEIRVFGSLARGEETGMSDVDIFILVDNDLADPIERLKPYYNFFSDKLDIAVDILVATKDEIGNFQSIIGDSILLYKDEGR